MDIVKNIQPASFSNGVKRYNQTFLIVKMIKEKIEQGQQIVREDIVNTYLENFFPGGNGIKLGWVNDEWRTQYCNKETYIKNRVANNLDNKALNWFMSNLGAAIIKGKLLVIPVIDIEQKDVPEIGQVKEIIS